MLIQINHVIRRVLCHRKRSNDLSPPKKHIPAQYTNGTSKSVKPAVSHHERRLPWLKWQVPPDHGHANLRPYRHPSRVAQGLYRVRPYNHRFRVRWPAIRLPMTRKLMPGLHEQGV